MVTFPVVISHLPGGRLVILYHFHHSRDSIMFLVEQPLWIRICIFSRQCIDPVTIYGLMECLIHHHCFQQIVVSDQETHFTAKNGLILMEFINITMFPSNKGHEFNTQHSEVINMKNYKHPWYIEAILLLFTHSVLSESFATLQTTVHQTSLSEGFPR